MHTRWETSTLMTDLPASIAPLLRRLTRRIAVGQFLEVWPRWATASLLIAGTLALVSRIFFAGAGFLLPWLWLAPLLATIPAILFCLRRAYRPAEVAALADSLSGGHGTLLTVFETGAPAWSTAVTFPMPRLRPWRKLAPVRATPAKTPRERE